MNIILKSIAHLAIAGSLLSACGGPLSHVVDIEEVPADKRDELTKLEASVQDAETRRNKAQARAEAADDKVAAAEENIERKQGDLEIAEATLELEEAKDSAGRVAKVKEREADIEKREQALAVAEATRDLTQAEKTYYEALAVEVEKEWLVKLATFELEKVRRTGGSGAEHRSREAEFEQQLAEQQADYAAAKKAVAEAEQDTESAKAEVKAAASSRG